MDPLYTQYAAAIRGERLPCALVDLDAFDANLDRLLAPVRAAGKTLRVASKSVRCVELLRRVTERGAGVVRGVMAYAVSEAAYLVQHGFLDVFVAYPTLQPVDLRLAASLNGGGAWVGLMVDAEEQIAAAEAAGREAGVRIPLLLDVDMSWRPLGGLLHVGVRRSPLWRVADVIALAARIQGSPHLRFGGVMGYEAHIAGLQDRNPFAPAMNGPKRVLKAMARGPVRTLRAELVAALAARSIPCRIVNGGGTGSVDWSSAEGALTEVTAGSGFLDGHLFDYFVGLKLRPAALFALQVVRRPGDGFVTCHGGGWVASGEAGADKLPIPYLPPGLTLLPLEGAGEVQTPLRLPPGMELPLGAPVFFRHAKAGELAEHVAEYLLVRDGVIVGRAPTYRGAGQCFLG